MVFVAAVVVTYNRKQLLSECLDAILAQTVSVGRIVLVNNASTDGTEDMLKEKGYLDNPVISYVKLDKNTGGAGGFYTGISKLEGASYDYAWIMDDDTIPEATALEKLVEALEYAGDVSFLASSVYGLNGECMNVPVISWKTGSNGYGTWHDKLKHNMAAIQMATFVSILVNRKAIEKCGRPCYQYFLWGDDYEYTKRLTTYYGDAYLVGGSEVCHKRASSALLNILTTKEPAAIKRHIFQYRNGMVNSLLYDKAGGKARTVLNMCKDLIKALGSGKYAFLRASVIIKGAFSGICFKRKIKAYLDKEMGRL